MTGTPAAAPVAPGHNHSDTSYTQRYIQSHTSQTIKTESNDSGTNNVDSHSIYNDSDVSYNEQQLRS